MQTFRKRRAGLSATAGLSCFINVRIDRSFSIHPETLRGAYRQRVSVVVGL